MKIALLYGKFSSGIHGQFDAKRLFEHRALTGSESNFFNTAKGLAELGHKVDVYCDVIENVDHCEKLSGASVYHIDNDPPYDADAFISYNEPDQLRRVPADVKGIRIVSMQLNDFVWCQDGFENFVDIFAFVSPMQREYLLNITPEIKREKTHWIPNSINLEIFDQWQGIPRVPHSMIWCSSPDRGLHRLLRIFPDIRKKVPDATLKIFYRFDPWYQAAKDQNNPIGARARYIEECFKRLGRNGENGVHLIGAIPNQRLSEELSKAEVLPYTCETISFTEGFSVSTMDACASGVIPIISDIDAIGDIYRNVAYIVPGKVSEREKEWTDAIVKTMTDSDFRKKIQLRARRFAERFSRQNVAKLWEILIASNLGRKSDFIFKRVLPITIQEYAIPTGVSDEVRLYHSNDPTESEKRPTPEPSSFASSNPLQTNSEGWQTWDYQGKKIQIWVDRPGAKLYLNEPEVHSRFWKISPGDVVLDIGAANGEYTLPALAMGAAHVVAWAPEEPACATFKKNIKENRFQRRVTILRTGLWSERGYIEPRLTHLPLFRQTYIETTTPLIPVEPFHQSAGAAIIESHDRLDWIKIDVEGCELQVLRGAEAVIRKYSPHILIEIHEFMDKDLRTKVVNYLNTLGYSEKANAPYPDSPVSHSLFVHPSRPFREEPEPPHRRWMRSGEMPPGGHGPICQNCQLSRHVELGGASSPLAFHPNIDIRKMDGVDIVHDLTKMPLPLHDGHATKIKSVQSINHIPHIAAIELLKDCLRILAPGGEITIIVTDAEFAMQRAVEDGFFDDWMTCIYGTRGDTYDADFHYWGYSPSSLIELLSKIGYENPRYIRHYNSWEFEVQAEKPKAIVKEAPKKAPPILKNTPEVSILVSTFRPGGLDLTFAGMRDQTHRDFELILIDKRYEKRSNQVTDFQKKYGDWQFIYAPEHRSNGKWVTFCSAWNTGIALARGRFIIFLQDYAYAPPGWIEAHLEALYTNVTRLVVAPYNYYDYPQLALKKPYDFAGQTPLGDRCTELDPILTDDILDEIQVFQKGAFDPSWIPHLRIGEDPAYSQYQWKECRSDLHKNNIKIGPDWIHVKNESMSRDLIYKMNGLDERLERGKGPMDIDIGIRAINAGAELFWNEKCPRHTAINPRFFCRNHPWGAMSERLEGRWSYDDGLAYNELQKSRGTYYAQNPYHMADMAKRLESWRDLSTPKVSQNLSDLAYWRQEIWPDTPLFFEPTK